jgi:hypothetical protein
VPVIYETVLGERFARLLQEEQQSAAAKLANLRRQFKAEFSRRSRKGNLWARLEHPSGVVVTLTVFANCRGTFSYCVADASGPRYSELEFDTEAAALEALTAAWLGTL